MSDTNSNQPEELLKPRYKVIADYPKSTFTVGEIYPAEEIKSQSFYNQYPHLFKKLEWWEERKTEELPKYLKYPRNGNVFEPYMIYADIDSYYLTETDHLENTASYLGDVLPATEEEFLNQTK